MAWRVAGSLVTLLAEVNAAYPNRDKRTDGAISGHPGSISSHNVNSAGVVCALDITTGDYEGGITTKQGQALAERLRIASRDQPRGLPVYGIHFMEPPYVAVAGPKICSAPDYAWRPYGGPLHKDHVHWSVDWDILAGGSPSGQADYDTTISWNLDTLTGQGSGATPIMEEGFLMALPDVDQIEIRDNLRKLVSMTAEVQGNVKDINTAAGPRSLRQFLADAARAAQAAASNTAPIRRGGQQVSLRQEVADAKSTLLAIEPVIVDIAAAVTADPVDGAQ